MAPAYPYRSLISSWKSLGDINPAELKINFRYRLNRVNQQFHGSSCLILGADTLSNTGKIYMSNPLISITQTELEGVCNCLVCCKEPWRVSCGPVKQSRQFDEKKTVSIWGLMTHTDSRKAAGGCHHQQQEVINVHKLQSAFLHEYAGAGLLCSPADTSIFLSSPVQLLYPYQQSPQIVYRGVGWSGYLAALKLSPSDKYHTFCSRKG